MFVFFKLVKSLYASKLLVDTFSFECLVSDHGGLCVLSSVCLLFNFTKRDVYFWFAESKAFVFVMKV